jgi:uroporphyrinogen-III decarboxylase
MNEIIRYESAKACRKSKEDGYPAVWVGGWRTAPELLSPQMWCRFVWPYLNQLILEVIHHKLIPLLHLDGNWDRELARFKALPAGKMIFAFDGYTDIMRAKEILGNHSCIMGDVPATMLFNSTPEEVYEYSLKLVNALGPRGFILHSGCDIPENAKLENVQAMVSAAVDG